MIYEGRLKNQMDNLASYFDCNTQNGNIKLLFLIGPKTYYFPIKQVSLQ